MRVRGPRYQPTINKAIDKRINWPRQGDDIRLGTVVGLKEKIIGVAFFS